jgi:hypothetical protein
MNAECPNAHWAGINPGENQIAIEFREDCGKLAGVRYIDSIDGHNLFTDLTAAHDSVDDACRAKRPVTMTNSKSGEQWAVTCTKPLVRLPPVFKIVSGG